MSTSGAILFYGVQALLVAAAIQDVLQLRIANLFSLAVLALYGAWLVATGIEPDVWQNLLVFAIVLAAGTFLFSMGWLGGGDAKLLAAISIWFDASGALALIVSIAVAGGLVALVFILLRRVAQPANIRFVDRPALKPRGPIPYGLAIAAGAIVCLNGVGPNPQGGFAAPVSAAASSAG